MLKIWPKTEGYFLTGEEKVKFDADLAEQRKYRVADVQPTREARALLGLQLAMLEAGGVDVPLEASAHDAALGLWALNIMRPEQHPLTKKMWDHFMRSAGATVGERYANPEPASYKEAFDKIAASARVLHPKWFARKFNPRRRLLVVYNDDSTVDVDFVPCAN